MHLGMTKLQFFVEFSVPPLVQVSTRRNSELDLVLLLQVFDLRLIVDPPI